MKDIDEPKEHSRSIGMTEIYVRSWEDQFEDLMRMAQDVNKDEPTEH